MAYKVHLANSVREKFRKMVKKDSLSYKRPIKLFDQLAENPYAVGKGMHSEYAGVRERHIRHFAVKYVIDDKNSTVTVVDYDHHV